MLNLCWSTGPWRNRTGFTGAKKKHPGKPAEGGRKGGGIFHSWKEIISTRPCKRNSYYFSAQLTPSFFFQPRPPVLVLMPVMQRTASYVPSPCLGRLAQHRHRRLQRHGQHRHGRPRRDRRCSRQHGKWPWPQRCARCAAPPTMRPMRHWAGRCDGLG